MAEIFLKRAKIGNTVLSLIVWILEVHQDIETVFPTLANQTLKPRLFYKSWLFLFKNSFKMSWKHCIEQNVPGSRLSTLDIGQVLDITMNLLF